MPSLFSHPAVQAALPILGSLVAVLALWRLAAGLKLGGDARIRDADHARELASAALCGFEPAELVLDRARIGAVLRDGTGRVMVLRRQGSRFVGRLLTSHAGVRLDRNFLILSTGERRFGSITLDLGAEAQTWAASLRRL